MTACHAYHSKKIWRRFVRKLRNDTEDATSPSSALHTPPQLLTMSDCAAEPAHSSPSKRYRCDIPEQYTGSQGSSPPAADDKTRSNMSNSKQVLQNAAHFLNNCFDEVKLNVLDILQIFSCITFYSSYMLFNYTYQSKYYSSLTHFTYDTSKTQ